MPTTAPVRFSHAVISCYDKPALLKWYCDVLGGHVVMDLPDFGMMTFDDEHHRIGIMELPSEPEAKAGGGVAHLAFAFTSVRDLLTHYRAVKALGEKPSYCTNHGVTYSMYYIDPEGNRVELFVDLLDPVRATELMKTPAFAANAIGITFDPEEELAKMDAGATEEELSGFWNPDDNVAATEQALEARAASHAEALRASQPKARPAP
jgi:catechol 2,3-dioxygenase-like lactoylglutathione lyase family enzyme